MMGLRECWQKLLDWVCCDSVRRVFSHLYGKATSSMGKSGGNILWPHTTLQVLVAKAADFSLTSPELQC